METQTAQAITNFMKTIMSRLNVARNNNPEVDEACKKFGDRAKELSGFLDFESGIKDAVEFTSQWLPWVLGKKIVTYQEVKELPAEALKLLKVYVGYRSDNPKAKHIHTGGRGIVIDGHIISFGLSDIYAYGDSTVIGKDQCYCQLYDKSQFKGSGWVTAFSQSSVNLRGFGLAELYDYSSAVASGHCLVVLNDNSYASTTLDGHIDDLRQKG